MIITPDHWLERAQRERVPGGGPMRNPRFLVIHYTSGASALSSINFWRTTAANGASAHIVIDRDGKIYQCRALDRSCGHAGKSRWKGYEMLNVCSIGIELANAGDDMALAQRWSKLPLITATHKHEPGNVKQWEAYPQAQLRACEAVAQAIVQRYKLEDVIGHEDCSPGRKIDPGPAFPMEALRLACGFEGEVRA
jgi:N-acetylmuramoyl-L-alanine amidase